MVPKTHFSEIPVNQGHVRVMSARKDANTLHSLPCHHLRERPTGSHCWVRENSSAQACSLPERRGGRLGSQLSTAASPHSRSGLCAQRPPGSGSRAGGRLCPGGLASAGPRGAEPWKVGGPWGSRTVLLKPGRAGPPADTKRGAPRGPRDCTAPPGSPAQRHAGGQVQSHCTEPFTSLYLKWVTMPLNCP